MKRTWTAGKPKKKPDYEPEQITDDLLNAVIAAYAVRNGKHPSLQTIVAELQEQGIEGLNPLKVRKLLITAGVYESPIAEAVLELWNDGVTSEEIQDHLHLSRASVHSYLPYSRVIYKLDDVAGGERSVAADRQQLFRDRKSAVGKLQEILKNSSNQIEPLLEQQVWDAMIQFQNYPFLTSKGLKFTYTIHGNEIFFTRKEKGITRSTVDIALQKAIELGDKATGPKKLGVFGASYLYPVFVRIGIVNQNAVGC